MDEGRRALNGVSEATADMSEQKELAQRWIHGKALLENDQDAILGQEHLWDLSEFLSF